MEWIAALISGLFSLVVCIVNSNASIRKRDEEQNKRIAEIDNKYQQKLLELSASMQQSLAVLGCKIDELDRKQAIHNGVIERVYKLENGAAVTEEKIKVANNRIADLERSKQ